MEMQNGVYLITGVGNAMPFTSSVSVVLDFLNERLDQPYFGVFSIDLALDVCKSMDIKEGSFFFLHKDEKMLMMFCRNSKEQAVDDYERIMGAARNVAAPELTTVEPILSLIYASDKKGGIGKDGGIPWKSSADMKWFKERTVGKPIIMGRKTWESLGGRMLPDRAHFVVSREGNYTYPKAINFFRCESVMDAIKRAMGHAKAIGVDEVFVIGGGEIYDQTLPNVDRIYHTVVEGDYDCDTFFIPNIEGFTPSSWVSSPEVIEGQPDVTMTVRTRISSFLTKQGLSQDV